jgi:hypothetical protein
MAYVHIRISDDFYKAVQSVLSSELNTDLSSFVRRILLDTLLIYGAPSSVDPVLAELGLKHEAQAAPCLILDLAKDWYLVQVLNEYSILDDDPQEKRRIRSKLAREWMLTIEQPGKNKAAPSKPKLRGPK